MSLAENIRRFRLRKQMTQPALAEKADLSKGYIFQLESGVMTNPSLGVLQRISEALGCTIADLIGQPRVAPSETPPDIPPSLQEFAARRKRSGTPLPQEDLESLARTKFRGRQPKTLEDWAWVYEFLKRTLGEEQ